MGKNHRLGKIQQWANIDPEIRSQMMSDRVKLGWSRKTKAEKRAKAMLMVKARLAKAKLSTSK